MLDPITDTPDLITPDLITDMTGLYNYRYARPYYARTVGRYYNYAPGDYQPHDPYYGTPFENVAPYSGRNPNNPYRGTIWYGVAPY